MNGRALGGVPEVSVPKPLTFSKRPQLASLDSLIMVVAPVRWAANFSLAIIRAALMLDHKLAILALRTG